MSWKYKNKNITEESLPEGAVGFIYKITRIDNGRIYIGKKQLAFSRRKKLTKAEKLLPENKRRKFKVVQTNSGWQTYWGSCKELIADVNLLGEQAFKREIIEFCFDKKSLTYREVWHQFKFDVLEIDSYNGNILSRFFRKKEEK